MSFKQEGANFKNDQWQIPKDQRAQRRVESAFFAVETGWQFSKNNKQGN